MFTPKITRFLALAGTLALSNLQAQTAPGAGADAGPGSSHITPATLRIFGENPAFSATMEFRSSHGNAATEFVMPGKFSVLNANTRFEINLTDMRGANIPPQAAVQAQSMGMDQMVIIARRDKLVSDIIYPRMHGYLEIPLPAAEASAKLPDFKLTAAKLGEEAVEGHACVKNKVTVTDKAGAAHVSTVWNAADLQDFPVKIESDDVTLVFRDVKDEKPDAAQFDPPADCKKYSDIMALISSHLPK